MIDIQRLIEDAGKTLQEEKERILQNYIKEVIEKRDKAHQEFLDYSYLLQELAKDGNIIKFVAETQNRKKLDDIGQVAIWATERKILETNERSKHV
jgi:hypothetical protein